MGGIKRIRLAYAPRVHFRSLHKRAERFAIVVAHRRAGKTVASVNDMIKRAISLTLPNGRFAYIAPYLSQAKQVAWEYLKEFSRPIMKDKNEAELWIELLNGARIRVHGADNPDRLRGDYLDGAVCDEYADWRPSVWGGVIRPMLADRQGWALFIGTPKGHNEFYKRWNDAEQDDAWFRLMLRASETGILPQSELDLARRDMTQAQYDQEFECSFSAAIMGAYYAAEIDAAKREDRIGIVPYDATLPVHTAWDLGMGDSTAIWFWQAAIGELRIIDFYEASGQPLSHYANVIRSKGYEYGTHWLPHDAKVRSLSTGRTRVETLIELGIKPRIAPNEKVMDGINAVRITLPDCWIDKDACSDGIEALRQYRSEYDERLKIFKDAPRHDWSSHAADAFRYLCLAYREQIAPPPPESEPEGIPIAAVRDRLMQAQMMEGSIRR